MELAMSEIVSQHDDWRDAVRRFLREWSPESAVREAMETEAGYDHKTWLIMADQLGLQGLLIPEAYGGSGFTIRELGIVMEEMGRALLCGPYLSTAVLAATLL